MSQSRRTELILTYQGRNITRDIAPYLLSFTFTDNTGDKADDIALTLEDRDSLWSRDWMPTKGDVITASIVSHDSVTKSLPCGSYEVDQIEYSYPPRVLSIKGISTAITRGMRKEAHSKSWENIPLSGIIGSIAGSNGLGLNFDGRDYMLKRREQVNKPDLEFASDLCRDYGKTVKVRSGTLIVIDDEENESRESVTSLDADDGRVISAKFTSKSAGVYRKARVKYHDSVKDETYDATEEDDDEEGSERVLEIRTKADSQGDAKAIARSRLKAANKREVTGSISLMGDPRYLAGVNVNISGFGAFSGKHTVTKATHKIDSSGYVTTLELGETSQSKSAKKGHKAKRKSKKTSGATLFYEGTNYYGYEGD